ncbi:sensor histidine kinase [Microaerobacter geothermalis]|uniref:sensor histidine kinase n=1 Tax=Microaerobacter geothermalis TaxID=674972 RepID=UPI001F176BC8|nr:HAMP domain-containing sensor histidine kinase [Microaerobacter geothermalis]MCF6093627.1 sensor histidine kinase [Microaerobacter geothermalis]
MEDLPVALNTGQDELINSWFEDLQNQYPVANSLEDELKNQTKEIISILLMVLSRMEEPDETESSTYMRSWANQTARFYLKNHLPLIMFFTHMKLMNQHLLMGTDQCYKKPLKGLLDQLFHLSIEEYSREEANLLSLYKARVKELHVEQYSVLGKMAASMAHELRNPLFAMEGFLKLIRKETKENTAVQRYIQVILEEYSYLYRQINQFLSFSKKKLLEERWNYHSIRQLVTEVSRFVEPRCLDEKIIFTIKIDLEEDEKLYCQKENMKQVFLNLFSNGIDAVTFSDQEKRKIHLHVKKSRNHYIFSFENNGPTIPEENIGKIFDPFFSTKKDGFGIGLSTSRNIIEKHNGNLVCHSNEQRTSFLITLPI